MGHRRVVLVTGASRGIGRAICLAFARTGHAVACFGRDEQALDETSRLVRQQGGEATVFIGDARSASSIETFASAAVAGYGGIDVVVNNAGFVTEGAPEDTTPEQFSDMLQVNLVSQFVLARAAFPSMRSRGGGVIVNIGSLAGAIAFPRTTAYCASKAGIEGMTRSLAHDWARYGIRVLCVAPGYVDSEFVKEVVADDKKRDWVLRRIPLGRLGAPADIAEFVHFLASGAASFCTGETYYVDGGQRIAI